MTRTLLLAEAECLPYATRSVRRASGFVLVADLCTWLKRVVVCRCIAPGRRRYLKVRGRVNCGVRNLFRAVIGTRNRLPVE